MLNILSKIILSAATILCMGCSSELETMLPYEGNKLIIFSSLNPLEDVQLTINRTYPPTGIISLDTTYLKSSTAELYEDGRQVGKFIHKERGLFILQENVKIKEGSSYQVKARAKNFLEAESEPIIIPSKPIVKSWEVLEKITPPLNKENNAFRLRIEITEPNIKPHYSIKAHGISVNNEYLSGDFYLLGRNTDARDDCAKILSGSEWFINKLCSNGSMREFNFSVSEPKYKLDGRLDVVNNIVLDINLLSDSYYKFKTTVVTESSFEIAFVPTKPQYTNVKNGFGAVIASHKVQYTFPFPKL